MHDTRKNILDILKEQGQCTVDEIVHFLQTRFEHDITAVTVRHHLNILQQQNFIEKPELRHRTTPGRPQYTYALSKKAQESFPNNYKVLAENLLIQLREQLPTDGINVILEGVAERMASQFTALPNIHISQRLDAVVQHLNNQGYNAYWEKNELGYILHTRNCPYHGLTEASGELCNMDFRLITGLVGHIPRRLGHISDGDKTCSYLILKSE